MATKAKGTTTSVKTHNTRKKRPGVHSKSKASKLKGSKNYLKKKCGQGK